MNLTCASCKVRLPEKANPYTIMECPNCDKEYMFQLPYGWLGRSHYRTFEQEYKEANNDFQKRYSEIIALTGLSEENLRDSEKRWLLWLASWDTDTAASFISIVRKTKNNSR